MGVTGSGCTLQALNSGLGGVGMTAAKWTVWLEVTRTDGTTERRQIGAIERDAQTPRPDDLGLRLAESKNLLHGLQARLVKDQIEQATTRDRICRGCGSRRSLHDHRRRVVHTLFGQVGVRQPRWRACSCLKADDVDRPAGTAAGADHAHALLDARATPELIRVQAELGARLSFREASRVMALLLPADTAANHTSVRRRLGRMADRLQALDDARPHRMSLARSSPMIVSVDGAHIRAIPGFQTRHFEVTVGRAEAEGRPVRHFAVAPNVTASRPGTIRNALKAQGWLPGREVIALTDGDPALAGAVRSAVRDQVTHILDWFHISMRVRHVEQALTGLLGADLEHKGPLSYAVLDVERLRHLIWNGYGKEASRALSGILQMANNAIWLNGENGRSRIERFGQLARELKSYLDLNQTALIDYGRRYRAGLPIATSRAESTVNSLVNARMNKSRQMRWSPQGAHRVLQVRAAVVDGRLSAGQHRIAA